MCKILIGCICYISLLCNANAGVLDCQFDTFVGLLRTTKKFYVKDSSVEGLANDLFSVAYTLGQLVLVQVFEGRSDAWFWLDPMEKYFTICSRMWCWRWVEVWWFFNPSWSHNNGWVGSQIDTPEIASAEQDRIIYRRTPEQMIEAIHKGLEVPMYSGYQIEMVIFILF